MTAIYYNEYDRKKVAALKALLHGAGDAIVPQLLAEFLGAVKEII